MKKILFTIFIVLFTLAGQSDYPKRIKQAIPLKLEAPNGGEEWILGFQKDIEWKYSAIIPDDTIIRLKLFNRGRAIGLIDPGPKPLKISKKKFDWKIGHFIGGIVKPDKGYVIKIYTRDHRYMDSSDESFSIIRPPFKKFLEKK